MNNEYWSKNKKKKFFFYHFGIVMFLLPIVHIYYHFIQGMEEILNCFLKDDNPDMTRQIQFIIQQLNSGNSNDDAISIVILICVLFNTCTYHKTKLICFWISFTYNPNILYKKWIFATSQNSYNYEMRMIISYLTGCIWNPFFFYIL